MRSLLLLGAIAASGCVGASGNDQPPLNGIGGPYDCVYPDDASGELATGERMPRYVWENAQRADGSSFTFDLGDFHCSPEYDDYSSLILVVSAGWCAACPGYIQSVNAMQPGLEEEGALVVYLETQTRSFEAAGGDDAAEFLNELIADGPGLRVGDGDNSIPSDVDRQIRAFPTGFFIRRRDMRIVLAEDDANVGQLPYPELAAEPDADWETRIGGGLAPNCGAADEEAGEPNDSPNDAATIGLGTIAGGVCDPSYLDHFYVDVSGPWHLDLRFTHATGDLDVFVLDPSTLTRLAGSTSVDDDEALDWEGPALVAVVGQRRSTAPYTLTITAR